MRTQVIKEYKLIRQEIISLQSCITEYIKTFYTVAVALIGAYTFWGSWLRSPTAPASSEAYIPIFFAFITLSFATVIFHKFNAHNRYAGYARALAQERSVDSKKEDDEQSHLWESMVGFIYNAKGNLVALDFSNRDQKNIVERRLRFLIGNCSKPLEKWPIDWGGWGKFGTARKIGRGFAMMARATIFRAKTQSWTYPFQIAFAPLISTLILLGVWIALSLDAEWHPVHFSVQFVAMVYLVASRCGLAYRLYRLCDDDGDRTIEAYCLQLMLARYTALKMRHIDVTCAVYPLIWENWEANPADPATQFGDVPYGAWSDILP